jgi:sporulation protein YlmC with PRC-barrel domain
MPEHDLETLLGWRGRTVVDRKGERLGKVGDLYLDETTDLPAYASVRTGLFGRHESIVPLAGIREEDDDLIVPYDAELARHYETGVSTPAPTNSTEMVRSEEEVVTGTTEPRPTERVRIRKVLVTDHVTRKVPVRREEIRLETDPPPEGEIERVDDVSD